MAKAVAAPFSFSLALAWTASLATLAFVCVACEEPAEPPRAQSAAAETSSARALCQAGCARSIRCEGPRDATCGCGSVNDSSDVLRADWAQADIACLGRTACDATEDCESAAYRAIGAAPLAWPPVVLRCLQRGDACGGSSAACRRLAAMTDDRRAEADLCFDLPCDAYAACVQSFFASRVAPVMPAWRPSTSAQGAEGPPPEHGSIHRSQ